MNTNKIVDVSVSIEDSVVSSDSYNYMLIIGPAPISPGSATTPDVAEYGSLDDVAAAGFGPADALYNAAALAFRQDQAPSKIYIAPQKKVSGVVENVTDTLDRAANMEGWYAVTVVGVAEDKYSEIAKWVEDSGRYIFCFGTTSTSASPVTGDLNRTFGIHQTYSTDNAPAAWLARVLSFVPGSETWAYKHLTGVDGQDLTSSEATTLDGQNLSYYAELNGTNVTFGGKTVSGEWIDTIRFRDWLVSRIQSNVCGLLVKNGKIPYTDAGISLIQNQIIAAMETGRANGGINADEYLDGVLVPGYAVSVPQASSLSSEQRKSRKFSGVRYTARLAGAIHIVSVSGTLTY